MLSGLFLFLDPIILLNYLYYQKLINLCMDANPNILHPNRDLFYFKYVMFYKILNSLADVEIPKDTGDFRLVDKKVIDIINSMPEHNKYLRGLFSWVGFRQIPYEYERQKRYAGKTKYSLSKMLNFGLQGIIHTSSRRVDTLRPSAFARRSFSHSPLYLK